MIEYGRTGGRRRKGGNPPRDALTRSVPALAAQIRQIDRCALPASATQVFSTRSLSPAYTVQNHSGAKESQTAVTTVSQVADRMRRMAKAYGEWKEFDISAFFDLWPEHARRLIALEERVSTVNVTFYADMLLPSFQRVEQYWAQEFFPAYQSAQSFARGTENSSIFTAHFLEFEQPKMCAYLDKLMAIVSDARRELWNDIGFLGATAGGDEKANWQWAWRIPPPPGLDERLLPPLRQLPTLTLGIEFPLPAYRQPDRLRRLRRTWESASWRER